MKKHFIILIFSLSLILIGEILFNKPTIKASAAEPPRLAIVIDDFGEDRRGVEEMLSLPCKLTIAVLPGMEYTKEDSASAIAHGHEVILHMPMENQSYMPDYYYGTKVIRNSHTPAEATSVLIDSLNELPEAVGINIHMGTGVSQNKELLVAMMAEAKNRGLYFLDSKTIENTKCPEAAKETGIKFYSRDFFLEPPGKPSYTRAVEELEKAAHHAEQYGKAVAIGHVGPVGCTETAKAIANTLESIKNKGIEVVFLSEL